MVYLDVDKLENITFCKIMDERELNVENGLAITKVLVGHENSQGGESCYETYTVVREVIDELMGGRKRYELANTLDDDFKLAPYVVSIKRTGKHFIFEVRNGIHDEDTIWFDYYHYEYDEISEAFKNYGHLGGKPTLTKSDDLVIINDSRLYSLSKHANVGNKYTRIEDCDGNRFFVHDDITTTKPSSLHNHLMFDINTEGNKTSKVFSTNLGTFTEDDLSVPYDEIRDKEIGILDSKLAEEEKYKMLMKSASGYEQ
ncbi:MAG: hypothetical protein K2L98_01570 [Bacilli bacterium]|nr:hypothetical protein [Bacilli bacterium]